jgi:hypothetical protein
MSLIIGDVDIDFADRNLALSVLNHTPASIIRNNSLIKHNTGVYFHTVPIDPITKLASLPYDIAADRGWYKLDLLNVSVYEGIKNEQHLLELMEKPVEWTLFTYKEFVSKLIHLGNHADLVSRLKPSNVEHVAIILALIRPGKKHLIDKCIKNGFDSVLDEIWTDNSEGYSFKHAHAISYAMLVKVHANLIVEQLSQDVDSVS